MVQCPPNPDSRAAPCFSFRISVMESLDLSAPEQHDYSDPTVEQDADRLRAWLTDLPLMDVVETVRLVLNALDSLNEQRLEPEKRYQLLSIFRETAQRLFVTVDPLHLRQLALSRSQREQATEGVERLLLSMAGGYKILVKAHFTSADRRLPDDLFGRVVNHAMEHLSLVLLDSYRFYRSLQGFLFTELHQLYRIARHNGLLDVTVDDQDEVEKPLSIAASYHATLLLSLTDPFRLAEGEVGLLFDVLKQHADMCCVVPGNHWSGDPDGLFFVDLKGNDPPASCMQLEQPVAGREPYLLDARKALSAIRKQLEQTPAKVRMQSPEAMVLRRLLPEKTDPEKDREARYPDSRWTHLLLGLDRIHCWQLNTLQTGNGQADGIGSGGPEEPVPCRIVDTSDSGMCLAWDEGGGGDARVGELLGIVEPDHPVTLALVRSIRIYREGGMEIGVQLMRGSTAPVYCRSLEDEDANVMRALFMPAIEEDRVSATLLAARGFYKPDRRLLISVSGKDVRARAGRSIINGPVFDRFEFMADTQEKG